MMDSRCPCCKSAPGAHTCDPDCGGCADVAAIGDLIAEKAAGFVHPTHAAGPGFVHPTHSAYVATSFEDRQPLLRREPPAPAPPGTPTPGHLVGAFGRNVLDAVTARALRCASLVVEIIAPVAARPELGIDALTFALWKAEPETLKLPTAPDAILARPARERAEYRVAVQFVLDTDADLAVGHHTNEDVRTFLKNVRDWL